MQKIVKVVFLFLLMLMPMGCKEYKQIQVEVFNSEVVFSLPELPALGTLYVERLDTEKNSFQRVWMLSFDSTVENRPTVWHIVYGKKPKEAKIEVMSVPTPLKEGVLYAVGMDIGPIVASGYFILEKNGAEIKAKNLTYQETNAFRNANVKNVNGVTH
jgi:hypothetical protein